MNNTVIKPPLKNFLLPDTYTCAKGSGLTDRFAAILHYIIIIQNPTIISYNIFRILQGAVPEWNSLHDRKILILQVACFYYIYVFFNGGCKIIAINYGI